MEIEKYILLLDAGYVKSEGSIKDSSHERIGLLISMTAFATIKQHRKHYSHITDYRVQRIYPVSICLFS